MKYKWTNSTLKFKMSIILLCIIMGGVILTSIYGIKKLSEKYAITSWWHLAAIDGIPIETLSKRDDSPLSQNMINIEKNGNVVYERSYKKSEKIATAKFTSSDLSCLKKSKFTNRNNSKVISVDQNEDSLTVYFKDGSAYTFHKGKRKYEKKSVLKSLATSTPSQNFLKMKEEERKNETKSK